MNSRLCNDAVSAAEIVYRRMAWKYGRVLLAWKDGGGSGSGCVPVKIRIEYLQN
jgi:hypothetical protein